MGGEVFEAALRDRTAALLKMNADLQQKIADEKIAAAVLRQSESRLQQIVNGTADGILVLNREGVVLCSNTSAALLMGHPMEDLLGLDLRLPLNTTDTHEI